MRAIPLLLLVLPLSFLQALKAQPEFHEISSRTFDPTEILGFENFSDTVEQPSFRISEFVTLGQYKRFLEDVKEDSSKAYYRKVLPDSNMCLPKCYNKYMNTSRYDSFPVAGVSWAGAMEYCKWLTIKENEGDSIRYLYRLPDTYEWLSAYTEKKRALNMDQRFSDWLMTHKRWPRHYRQGIKPALNMFYIFKKDDPIALKRMVAIGDSYLYRLKRLGDYFLKRYYAIHGYRHISFRMVHRKGGDTQKTNRDTLALKYWGLLE